MENHDEILQELLDLEREALTRFKAKDWQWIADLHADGAMVFPPGFEPILASEVFSGNAAEQTENSDLDLNLTWEPTAVKVSPSNEMAYVHGTTKIEHKDGTVEHGKYVSVWIRVNGAWRVDIDIRNANQI